MSFDGFGHFDRVGGGLFDNPEAHRRLGIITCDRTLVFNANLSPADITESDQRVVFRADNQAIEFLDLFQFAAGLDGHLTVEIFNPPARQLDILRLQGALHIEHGYLQSRHAVGVQPDTSRIALLTTDRHRTHALHRLQRVNHDVLGKPRQFQRRIAVAEQGYPDHRIGVGLLFGNNRLFNIFWQFPAHARDAIADILGRCFNIVRQVELHRNTADLLTALADQRTDTLDAVDALFQPLSDLGFHHGRIRAGINGGDIDNRGIDVRQFAYRQTDE